MLGFWLFMMLMIVGGLGISLWLALRGGWRRPKLESSSYMHSHMPHQDYKWCAACQAETEASSGR